MIVEGDAKIWKKRELILPFNRPIKDWKSCPQIVITSHDLFSLLFFSSLLIFLWYNKLKLPLAFKAKFHGNFHLSPKLNVNYTSSKSFRLWAFRPSNEMDLSNLPFQIVWGAPPSPLSTYRFFSFSLGNDFVIISYSFFVVYIFSTCKCFFSSSSCIQWHLTLICLDFKLYVELFAKWMALWLSQYTIKLSCFKPNSCRKFFIHKVSLQPLVIASAAVVDRTTHYWSLDCHETAPPTKVSAYLDRDFFESTTHPCTLIT